MTSPGYGPGYPGAQEAQYLPGRYPVQFNVDYPPKLSRGLIFVKWLLVIPHLIILYVLELAAFVVTFIAWFAILFTGRFPLGMFNFVVGVQRWANRAQSYYLLQTDEYPPFRLGE